MFYTVKLDIDAMEYALDDKCGVYYNNKKIIDIKKGVNTYEAKIKTTSNEVHLVFNYKPWRPSDVMNSADGRIMGVGLSRITMQLEGANWKAKEIN
jgi:hypothetical protein